MAAGRVEEHGRAKRADARKNIAAIIDAATECLARDPYVSVNDIARAAGVGRMTLYGHFESRSALVAEVVARAIEQSEESLASLDLSGEPRDAMARLIETTWHLTHRFGALVVAAEQALPQDQLHEAHRQPTQRAQRVLRRGRRTGAFRTDMPVAWQVTMLQALLHSASAAVHRGEITATQAPRLIRDTALAALTPPGAQVP